MGRTMGQPGDANGQRAVLRGALETGAGLARPRSYVELPFEWPERRPLAIREPDPAPPIAQLLTRRPWLFPRLLSGRLP